MDLRQRLVEFVREQRAAGKPLKTIAVDHPHPPPASLWTSAERRATHPLRRATTRLSGVQRCTRPTLSWPRRVPDSGAQARSAPESRGPESRRHLPRVEVGRGRSAATGRAAAAHGAKPASAHRYHFLSRFFHGFLATNTNTVLVVLGGS
jgi:hypothetical protein